MTLLTVFIALLLDQLLGEPKRFHPLVGFGRLVDRLEQLLRMGLAKFAGVDEVIASGYSRIAGAVGWLCLVPLVVAILYWVLSPVIAISSTWELLVGSMVLYFCIGYRSLIEHARAVTQPLAKNLLTDARQKLSQIVSRDTEKLDKNGIVKATIESVLENTSDAVLAPIFWFVVAGIPGVLVYRLSNTMDAMWGYKTLRYRYFGWVAARMDDLLNWVPARCCALGYAVVGHWTAALDCWRQQAPQCDSPNAGPVMSAGAGALGVRLGGLGHYDGQQVMKPLLGTGRIACCEDVGAALQLVWGTIILWLGVMTVVELYLWL